MRLNLGCGNCALPGYINCDMRAQPGVQVVWNLDAHPWPWEDNSADEIKALNIFEHLDDFMGAMAECHRILKPGGFLFLCGPWGRGANMWADPTHKRGFEIVTFRQFDPETEEGAKAYYVRPAWEFVSGHAIGHDIVATMKPRK